ncbi:hypothetical protein BDN71DRAFT_934275 [Pleurotus eryngii]|uniref:Uncharacterized protein n=1 Tax=Pleurotus eryngii TaxID=5323 RepID=A0A9P6D6K3_PLEER|nr:hypothetical protein BDN71DRAFT_934275 [Pleurotus eryngii]
MYPNTLTKFSPISNEGQRYVVSSEEGFHRAPFSKLSLASKLIFDDYAHPRRAPSTIGLVITLYYHALGNASTRAITDTPIALLRSGNRYAATWTPIYLNCLALAFFARFQRNGDLLDLRDAVSKFREAVSLPGPSAEHDVRSGSLRLLFRLSRPQLP